MRIDVPLFLLAGALTVSGGAWVGYRLSTVARAAMREAPKPPPVEAAPKMPEVGVLQGILIVPTTVIYGAPRPRTMGILPAPPIRFFDFKHAICDEADGTHGRVMRCSKSRS